MLLRETSNFHASSCWNKPEHVTLMHTLLHQKSHWSLHQWILWWTHIQKRSPPLTMNTLHFAKTKQKLPSIDSSYFTWPKFVCCWCLWKLSYRKDKWIALNSHRTFTETCTLLQQNKENCLPWKKDALQFTKTNSYDISSETVNTCNSRLTAPQMCGF